MRSSIRPSKSILLNLPIDLAGRLDEAATALGLSRSDLIRRSLTRDLVFLVAHELARTVEHQRQTEKAYGIWSEARVDNTKVADCFNSLA